MQNLLSPVTFLDLPPEIRNYIYQYAVPPGSRFTASQRMQDINDEQHPRYAKANQPRVLKVAFEDNHAAPKGQLLSLCKLIHAEVSPIFEANVRGTFEFWIATDFKLIPQTLRNLVDNVVFVREPQDCRKDRYVLRFPNLKTYTYSVRMTSAWNRAVDKSSIISEIEGQRQSLLDEKIRSRSWWEQRLRRTLPLSWERKRAKRTLNVQILEQRYIFYHGLEANSSTWNGIHLTWNWTSNKCTHASAQTFTHRTERLPLLYNDDTNGDYLRLKRCVMLPLKDD